MADTRTDQDGPPPEPVAGAGDRFVALGDSLTEGRGDPDGATGFLGWPLRLLDQLRPPVGTRLVNLARRNADVPDVRDRQLALAPAGRAALVSIVVGVNDVCGGYRAEDFRRSFDGLLRAAVATGAPVVTATLPDISHVVRVPRDTAELLRTRLANANDAIRAAAGACRIPCLDLWHLSRSWPAECWSTDHLHPGPAGHRRIANGFRELLVAQRHPWASPDD